MGFFDHLQTKGIGAIQAQRPQIRQVKVNTQKSSGSKPPSVPAQLSASSKDKDHKRHAQSAVRSAPSPASASAKSKIRAQDGGNGRRIKSESSARKRGTPVQRLSSDDDEGSDYDDIDLRISKRAKQSASAEPDLKRRVRSTISFSDEGGRSFDMIHAEHVTSKAAKPEAFTPAFRVEGEPARVSFQYPGASQRERYRLVVPKEDDGFKPLDDIVNAVDIVSKNYIPEEHRSLFDDESTGIKRRLRRALAQGSLTQFRDVIDDYNKLIADFRSDGSISRHLDETHALSLPLVERILTQVYARTVSPRVESLRQYENGTDNVYGELLPRFISDIFKQTGLKSEHVFVDLGSGVGNVVLQAALEIGCESWGCEMMENACHLAELQQSEFKSRCRLWGIEPGKVKLIRGDFLEEEAIGKALRKADVILINNQAFTPQLNNELINHFLDMKEGCRIVSLRSFVPDGHKIQSRNLNSPLNLLSVEKNNYWSECVSWTNTGGSYFIATKDSSRLKEFMDNMS